MSAINKGGPRNLIPKNNNLARLVNIGRKNLTTQKRKNNATTKMASPYVAPYTPFEEFTFEDYCGKGFPQYILYLVFNGIPDSFEGKAAILEQLFYIDLRKEETFESFQNLIDKKNYQGALDFLNENAMSPDEFEKLLGKLSGELNIGFRQVKSAKGIVGPLLLEKNTTRAYHLLNFLMFGPFQNNENYVAFGKKYFSMPEKERMYLLPTDVYGSF
jgi:hypothetical protein